MLLQHGRCLLLLQQQQLWLLQGRLQDEQLLHARQALRRASNALHVPGATALLL